MAEDLLFAWLSPIESHVSDRRPKSPGVSSPLVRAKTAFRRTFTTGHKRSRRQRVRDAHDACLWLKAAGFPQYVHMFEDGQFPINLSKFQVEKDHSFLEQSALDALIRRLNVLNRCADLIDVIQTKGRSFEDEGDMRALSDHWHFKRKSHSWSRKSEFLTELEDSDQLLSPSSNRLNPLLVSELRGSLTDLDRRVKTYSFLPGDDQLPSILIESTLDSSLSKIADESLQDDLYQSREWEMDSFTIPRSGIDNFATGIIDTFESSMRKIAHDVHRSQSLPDVFAASKMYGSTDDSPTSSISVSTASIPDTSKNTSNLLNGSHYVRDSSIHMNGHVTNGELHRAERQQGVLETNGARRKGTSSRGSNVTLESSTGGSELGESERDQQDLSPQPQSSGRFSERSSTAEAPSFSDLSSPGVVLRPKKKDSMQRQNTKWHSFQRSHCFRQAFKPVRTLIPIEELSVGQIGILRKLSLVKLTALIELHKAKSNVARILKGRKPKLPDCKNKRMFGVPLCVNVRQTGKALPNAIRHAMTHIRETGLETKGIFRRAGSKAKAESLKAINEANPDNSDYEGFSVYDIADMIKLYFRELPEPLLTAKFSEILIVIHENVPPQLRLQALQSVMLLIPDENREALLSLLTFLKEVSDHADINQMDAQNLAVCFSPTLFYYSSSMLKPVPIARKGGSFRRTVVNHSPNPAINKEVSESVASSQCLAMMIANADKLFMVAADMLQVCKFTHLELGEPVPCHELDQDRDDPGNMFIDNCVATVLKEAHRKFKGWVHYDTVHDVEVSYLKPGDGVPLWLWRGTVEVQATHRAVFARLWNQRHIWDGAVTQSRVVSQIDQQTEVYQYVTTSLPPLTNRDHCIYRSWRQDPSTDSYVLVATSVSHPSADLLAGIRATELFTSYLIEPLDSETCKLTYICRVDLRGRSAEFYNNAFGPYLASTVTIIKDTFHDMEFLETPV